MQVVIVGTGYVGLTTGAALAYLGHPVTGVDKDLHKLELLTKGKCPIHEAGLQELMNRARDWLTFTDQAGPAVAEADVIVIAVGTPCRADGNADTSHVEGAAREVANGLQAGRTYTVVVKSTVPIGSNRRVAHVVDRVLADRGLQGKVTVRIASNPEFLREGSAVHDMLYPDRIVVGADEPGSADVLRRLYRPILEQTFDPPSVLPRPQGYALPPLITTDPISAEMIKYAANAFLAMRISFINEIASLCERVGADVTEVARGIGLDPRIGPGFLEAGLGWGGSCFPKDTAALLAMGKELSCLMQLVEASREVNFRQRERLVEKLQETLKGVRGRVIGVLGVAFKPATDDVRESPALDVVRLLLEREAHVRVSDPVALENAKRVLAGVDVEYFTSPYELAQGADAIVLATEWPEYRQLDLRRLAQSMRTPILLDGRNLFEPTATRAAGFTYLGVGR